MIKQFTLSLLAVLLLGSCSNKFSLVKRKYNKGYHFSVAKNMNKEKQNVPSKDQSIQTVHAKAASLPASSEKEIINSEEFQVQPIGLNTDSKESQVKKHRSFKVNKGESSSYGNLKIAASDNKVNTEDIGAATSKASADGNKILMIILCLFPFICLIPVYIHDGHKVTLNFWITLLLHLTFIGAMIFALLVVLDVINLA